MTTSVHLKNLGAHERTHVDLPRVCSVNGPSTAGKSTLADALCLVVTGEDTGGRKWTADRLRGVDEPARVTFELSSMTIRRGFASRPGVATIDQGDSGQKYKSQRDLDEALGMTGRRALVQCILAPFYWQQLIATSKGRGLRDALLDALPPVDIRPIVAESMAESGGMRDSDPMELGKPSWEGGALHLQKKRNSEADRAAGRVETLQGQVEAVQAQESQAPAPGAVMLARRIVKKEAQYKAWEDYSKAVATNELRKDDHAIMVEAWKQRRRNHAGEQERLAFAWDKRCASLGDRPEMPDWEPPQMAEHVERLREAREELDERAQELVEAEEARAAVDITLARDLEQSASGHEQAKVQLNSMRTTDRCPTCMRGADEASIAHLEARVKTTGDLHERRATRLRKEAEERRQELTEKVRDADASHRIAVGMLEAAQKRHDIAQKGVERHAAAVQAVQDWDERRRLLGVRPEPAPFTEPKPTLQLVEVPEPVERPDVDPSRFEGARKFLADAQRFEADHEDWQRRQKRAAELLDAAQKDATEAAAEAQRVSALVRALRAAPTRAAAMQVEALHAAMRTSSQVRVWLAPVGASGDVIGIDIEGRPWWLASDGMRVVADLALRDALRRLACRLKGLEWLAHVPLFVDRAQDYSDEMPDAGVLSGPTVYLYTIEGEPQNGPQAMTIDDWGA